MLFFSSDPAEVEGLRREFSNAGIPCESRNVDVQVEGFPQTAELWVRNDRDCHRALMLCVQRNLGFSRRPERKSEPDTEYVLQELPGG